MLITLLGPTATGKTKLAVALAHHLDGEIISADSRQVYTGMDIGTGKDLEDYLYDGQMIPCHLVDIAEPGEEYNVSKWQQEALMAMEKIEAAGKRPILCGGSGMYVEALLKGYRLYPVPPQPELRAQLEQQSDEELIKLLASFRPLHNHTDTCERPRLLQALELEIYYNRHPELQNPPISSHIFGLNG
ncbi:MAG: tRNA (adenosine(37)-N6)-dimethylallyltransferase MiaA, partial [Bacteroidales bacterium]|nr:tRNA (adenosine(37)-N6)-dimethylallyltransferase MiaA [Bacteroidales bacterium]